MKHELVFGFVGPRCSSAMRKEWNAFLREKGVDGSFDFYKASTAADLELRLSEMFLHNRRGYIIDSSLQKAIIPLLDALDASAKGEGSVDTALNRGGVLVGYFVGGEHEETKDTRLAIWEGK